jgi:phosphoserine phosphatase RsbU/P
MRILIAEDDLTSRIMLSAVLKKNGYDVVETTNGLEAWEEMQKPDHPRLVIFDWMMPEIDGLEVIRRIRALQSEHLPYIIILTTKGEKADMIAGLDAGADDYLAKPFHPGELHARVEVGRRMIEMQDKLATKIGELHQALDQIRTLRGIVPICASCKKIRDDAGYWQQLEDYVSNNTEAEFSHGICPECAKKLYPKFYKK